MRRHLTPTGRSSLSGSLYHHFAYLNDGGQVGVVRNVGHDLFRVRPEARLKRLDGITEDVAHANVGRRGAGCAAGEPFVDGVVETSVSQALLHQWHMLVTVVLVVETGSRRVRVHHADLDHHRPPVGCPIACGGGWIRAVRSGETRSCPSARRSPDRTELLSFTSIHRAPRHPEA